VKQIFQKEIGLLVLIQKPSQNILIVLALHHTNMGLSYVYEVYSTYKDLDWNKIEIDLDNLIDRYKKILQTK
jgi:hypothetical protein